ncbi:hypothetical protein NLN78_03260 [Citrobacter portucalensis]|uniref:hypothetical protein n=1 Tax=Citrobacter portucalensis TaxID=1639133 RepID=UPI002269EAB0|nr:hypothetical protein [Citrobacter portucalensis]MCX8972578.1 hypothetical protein [Citrobacter portucalensis]
MGNGADQETTLLISKIHVHAVACVTFIEELLILARVGVKYSDFKKMPYRQRRDYIKNGGKVERTLGQKIVYYGSTAFIILVVIWFVRSCSNQPRDNQYISDMMISMCTTEVKDRAKDPGSFEVDRANTITSGTADGYKVEMVFRAKNSFGALVPGSAICTFSKLGTDNKPLLESKEKSVLTSVSINGKRV